jgi:hypothetical protein
MAEETILARIRPRRGTAIAWTTANPILKLGELGLETDTGKFKAGDGVNLWSVLPYTIGADGTAATISIGTVSGLPSGSTPTVSNSGTSLDAVLDFELPVGNPGTTIPDPSGLTTQTVIANTDTFLFNQGASLFNVAWSTIIAKIQTALSSVFGPLASYPVGCFYTQYPNAASNDDATAFPTAYRPATLFGGTWVEQFATDATFFRTGGTDGQTRTNGLSADQMQGHFHEPLSPFTKFLANAGTWGDITSGSNDTGQPATTGGPVTDGTNGTPRTGTKTEPRNRLFKIWKRTA